MDVASFYAAYASGEEPEDDNWVLDFGEWASVYRIWLARQADYRNEIHRLQRQASRVSGELQFEREIRLFIREGKGKQ